MANVALVNIVLLSFISCGFTLSINDFWKFGNLREIQTQEPRVVEVIRWRQPVCLTPAPGVLPCTVNLDNSQSNNQVHPQYAKKISDDDLLKKLVRDDSDHDSSSLESKEDGHYLAKRSSSAAPTPKLFSPRVVRSVQLEHMGPSSLEDASPGGARRGRYLRLAPQMIRSSVRRETVYVTKVVDSPVVATLVATTCLPDIGIPLCEEIQNSHQETGGSYSSQPTAAPVAQPFPLPYGQQPSGTWNNNNNNNNNNNGQQQNPGNPSIVQNITDFLNPPNVVHTGQQPDIKPVIVVQPTSPPGIFDGINALLTNNGSWFNVFNRPPNAGLQTGGNGTNQTGGGLPGISGLGQFPQLPPLPQLPQLPQIPSLQDILYRPENDISDPPGILGVFNLTNNQPGAGPPTQSPGIFGGLFASPTRPEDANHTGTTSTTTPSFLDGIGNIFRPTNRPLVIESPNQRPIIVEKPVYVAELPVVPGIFDVLQNPNRPVHVNSDQEPQIIKDPTYVLQRPEQPPLIGGLVPNWNIFGTSSTTTSTTQTPEIHNNYSHSKSGTDSELKNVEASVTAVETSATDSVYSGINSEESSTTSKTDLENNDSLYGSLTEIVNAEEGPTAETYIAKEVPTDTSLLKKDEANQGLKKIDEAAAVIKKEIDNEA